MVWALCWKSARGNRSRCKDLLQEVSITLWIHFDELRPDAVLQEEKAWVRWWTRSVLDLQRRKERPSLLPLTLSASGIPFNAKQDQPILMSGYAQYFLSLLRILRLNFCRGDVLRLIKTGFTDMTPEEIMDMEN